VQSPGDKRIVFSQYFFSQGKGLFRRRQGLFVLALGVQIKCLSGQTDLE